MKKLFFLLAIMLLSVTSTTFMSCNIIDENSCELYEMDAVNRTFIFSGSAQKDSQPWQGTLRIVMYKTYCDGRENGRQEFTVNTGSDGEWKINWDQTYTYKNFDDYVTLEVYNEVDGGVMAFSKNWNWQAVDTEHLKTYVYYKAVVIIH
jgi:hypothetical protein